MSLAGGGKGEGVCLQTARDSLQPTLDQIAALEATLAPYENIKTNLSAARTRFRKLTNAFVDELKYRCAFMGDEKKRVLVLELLAQDVQGGVDAAVTEKQQELVRFVKGLWEKYATPLGDIIIQREQLMGTVKCSLNELGYGRWRND